MSLLCLLFLAIFALSANSVPILSTMSSSDLDPEQIVQAASPSAQDDDIKTPVPLDLSTNVPQTGTSAPVRNVHFSDNVLTMPQIVFLAQPGWFSF